MIIVLALIFGLGCFLGDVAHLSSDRATDYEKELFK